MIYVTFGAAEEDMVPAGDAAVGTYATANAVPGKDFPLVQKIEETVYGAGQGNLSNPERIGTVYWNRGVGAAVMWIEALKNAQEIHDKVGEAVTGAEFRDGYEALDMTEAKLEELGIAGMVAPFSMSCAYQGGSGTFRIMQWDGERFNTVTDWIGAPDPEMIRDMVHESAMKFAEEQGITPRECPGDPS
jgi:branched-chain amino acid transport system substrate-binding protein